MGEFAVIDRLVRGRRQSAATVLGPGDDAAVVGTTDGRFVVSTDTLVQDRHFRFDWSTPEQIGRKAIAQNAADVAAMGAQPTAYTVALACPPQTPVAHLEGITEGMWSEAARAGGSIVGGDLVAAGMLVITVTAFGDLGGRAPIRRSGACVGDVVAVTGRLGWSEGGLALLRAGVEGFTDLVAAHRVPQPPYRRTLGVPATAMTDVSDGLLADLGHMAAVSGVHIDIRSVDVHDHLLDQAADALGADSMEWVLTGGEDHAFVATFPPSDPLPQGWRAIGTVRSGAGVTVDGTPRRGRAGWDSFAD